MLLNVEDDAPIMDLSGQQIGKLHIKLELGYVGAMPVANFEQKSSTRVVPKDGESGEEQWAAVNFDEHKGEKMQITMKITEAHGLSGAAAQGGVFLRCLTDIEKMRAEGVKPIIIEPIGGVRGPEIKLNFDFTKLSEPPLNKDLQTWLSSNSLELELWGTGTAAPPGVGGGTSVGATGNEAELRAENERLREELAKQKAKTCQIL
ncbi:Hypothetical Protein FCC1311_007762 [Hondaea fermentalgiana]|uniref:Uncharacterized protein n=1 Tax=Hondaea fermentalgiana TaxID=2315210 RepID=A0A2R5G0K5_9STRA|nr:Hypothetical Protein FCC1311_007762 [Hondaea fermentalgiana]|eukprot:GBG24557.1 Hypothetical Protein FCC1311_007762 [Hondaea fermentalgiana]